MPQESVGIKVFFFLSFKNLTLCECCFQLRVTRNND